MSNFSFVAVHLTVLFLVCLMSFDGVAQSSGRERPEQRRSSDQANGGHRRSTSRSLRRSPAERRERLRTQRREQADASVRTPALSPEATRAIEQFEMTRSKMYDNQQQIDTLYRTMPIGFLQRQKEHQNKIRELTEQNQSLTQTLHEQAMEVFQITPFGHRAATNIVVDKLVTSLSPRTPDQHFDPQSALKISRLLIDDPNATWQALMKAFTAAYAVHDFELARETLDRLEAFGPVKDVYYNVLEETNTNWQNELFTRRQESETGDLPSAIVETTEGTFRIELFENQAPATVANFISLAEKGFYDGLSFFQVKPGKFAAAGCPYGSGTGDAGYRTVSEFDREQARHHFAGTVSMRTADDGTAGSIFLICHQPDLSMDDRNTAFGRVVQDGIETVYQLKTHDGTMFSARKSDESKIVRITIENKRDHSYEPVMATSAVTSSPVDTLPSNEPIDAAPSSFDLLPQSGSPN